MKNLMPTVGLCALLSPATLKFHPVTRFILPPACPTTD